MPGEGLGHPESGVLALCINLGYPKLRARPSIPGFPSDLASHAPTKGAGEPVFWDQLLAPVHRTDAEDQRNDNRKLSGRLTDTKKAPSETEGAEKTRQ